MKLLVVSHKPCWRSAASPSGFATDGGFPFQMRALSELFDRTTLLVPCAPSGPADGELPLTGTQLSVVPLTMPAGTGWLRKMAIAPWLLRNLPALWRAVGAADAVHAPIPGDVGTFGMLLAIARGKPLFVRHCGNWLEPRTAAEHAWKWAMQRLAGGRNVMLATGGTADPPSTINPAVRWIFSTTLNAEELAASAVERQGPAAGRLLIACRQDREKGADLVLESLALVRRHVPAATLDIVGDGPMIPVLTARAQALGVEPHVRFHGKLDHDAVLRVMRTADLFCYPTSASEGFPKVVLEALACGLPVVATRVSVIPQLLSSGCGVLLDGASGEELAEAIVACLSSPDHYSAMSRAAVATAGRFSIERWRDTIGESLRSAWGDLRAAH